MCFKCWNVIAQFLKLKLECLEHEQHFYEYLVRNEWCGTINDFVLPASLEGELGIDDETDVTVPTTIDGSGIADEDYLLLCQELEIGDSDEDVIPLLDADEKVDFCLFDFVLLSDN